MSVITFLFGKNMASMLGAHSPDDPNKFEIIDALEEDLAIFGIGDANHCLDFRLYAIRACTAQHPANLTDWETNIKEWMLANPIPASPTTFGFVGFQDSTAHVVAFDFDLAVSKIPRVYDYSFSEEGDVMSLFFCTPDVNLDIMNEAADTSKQVFKEHFAYEGPEGLTRCLYGTYKTLAKKGVLEPESHSFWQYPPVRWDKINPSPRQSNLLQ